MYFYCLWQARTVCSTHRWVSKALWGSGSALRWREQPLSLRYSSLTTYCRHSIRCGIQPLTICTVIFYSVIYNVTQIKSPRTIFITILSHSKALLHALQCLQSILYSSFRLVMAIKINIQKLCYMRYTVCVTNLPGEAKRTSLLLNLGSPRDYVGSSVPPFVRACGSVLDRKLLERLMSPSPKSQVMFASAFSWIGDFFRIFGIHIFQVMASLLNLV